MVEIVRHRIKVNVLYSEVEEVDYRIDPKD